MSLNRFAWIALAAVAAACSSGPQSVYSPSSGSLALSRNDQYLYAVDTDNHLVGVIDTRSMSLVTTVNVGLAPERIAVGPDDTIYVSNRGERTVSIISPGTWVETARIPVGVEPVGVAVSADGKTLYVVNATSLQDPSTGTLMAIDTHSHAILWDLPVGEEPRGIAVLANGNVAVTLYKQGDMAIVDPSKPQVAFQSANVRQAVLDKDTQFVKTCGNGGPCVGFNGGPNQGGPVGSPPSFASGVETFHPHGMGAVTVAPDGKTLFGTVLWDSDGIIPLNSSAPPPTATGTGTPDAGGGCDPGSGSSGGYGGGGGVINCGGMIDANPPGGTVVMPGTVTVDGTTATPLVDPVGTRQFTAEAPFPSTLLHIQSAQANPVQEPVALVADATASWLFVVNRASNNVAILPINRSGQANSNSGLGSEAQPWAFLKDVGNGPNGIALTRDGTKAYVYNSFDHTVAVLTGAGGDVTVNPNAVQVASDVLPPDQVAGRKLFFSAREPSIAAQDISISCGSCHLEGREDGQVWNFLDGPRQTPALVGRALDKTAPYHWSGVLPTIHDFMDLTISQRMGGSGISPTEEQEIASYLVASPAPDNPFRGAALNASQQRGAQLFVQAGCVTCHSGQYFTNNGFAFVGTQLTDPNAFDKDDFTGMPNGLNVPSLLGVSRSAPYLHSGVAATLTDRIKLNQGTNQHGQTSALSGQDVDDLVSFLKTL